MHDNLIRGTDAAAGNGIIIMMSSVKPRPAFPAGPLSPGKSDKRHQRQTAGFDLEQWRLAQRQTTVLVYFRDAGRSAWLRRCGFR